MSDTIIQQLTESFMRFPGIGPRQARRFVYYLLHAPPSITSQLLSQIQSLQRETSQCASCYRYFPNRERAAAKLCTICADPSRDTSLLMLVEKDTDLENVEKSDTYNGHFFVLGGLVKILDKAPSLSIRQRELSKALEERAKNGLQEVIAALSANQEGDSTVEYLKSALAPLLNKHNLRLSTLGRGLSTGVELEYSDADTIKNALKNRQ